MKEGLHTDTQGNRYLHVHCGSKLDLQIIEAISNEMTVPSACNKFTNSVTIKLEDGSGVIVNDIQDRQSLENVLETIRGVTDLYQEFPQYPNDDGIRIEFSGQADGRRKAVVYHAHPGEKIPGVTHYLDVKLKD